MVNIIRAWTNACITLISRYSSFLRKRDSLSLIKYIFIRIFVLSWSRTYILRNFCLNETVKFSFFRYYKLRTSREEFFVFILTRSRPSDCWFSSTSLLIQRSWWLPPLSILIKNRIWNRNRSCCLSLRIIFCTNKSSHPLNPWTLFNLQRDILLWCPRSNSKSTITSSSSTVLYGSLHQIRFLNRSINSFKMISPW